MSSENREFRMSPALLWKVIHDQAGTISKAILEGAMNSVDAGATYCDITISGDNFQIKDDGKGFVDENEISRFFESFGEEHVEGDAVYGRFRMGRGQIMAFGHNTWRTGEFLMDVNLKPQGQQKRDDNFRLGYDFTKGLPVQKGCTINVDLYPENHLKPSDLNAMIGEIERYVKYIDIPVTLNEKIISIDPSKQKWDIVNDDAYIKLKETGGLTIYNLGSLVKSVNSWQSGGMNGVVVSKKQLKVNFARNDVQSDCPVWKRISSELKNESKDEIKRAKPLTDDKRAFYARELVAGEITLQEAEKLRLITDVTNSHHPFKKMNSVTKISAAKRNSLIGETAHTRKMAFVVSQDCIERFGANDIFEFCDIINEIYINNGRRRREVFNPINSEDFKEVISDTHIPLKKSELKNFEKICVTLLNDMSKTMASNGYWTGRQSNLDGFSNGNPREIHAGKSETALAWTNGRTDIWFDKDFMVKNMKQGYPGIMKLASVMLHEYIHREADTQSHVHGIEFYEMFHEFATRTNLLANCVDFTMSRIIQKARQEKSPINRYMLSHMDRVDGAEKAIGSGSYDGFISAADTADKIETAAEETPIKKSSKPKRDKKETEAPATDQYSLKI